MATEDGNSALPSPALVARVAPARLCDFDARPRLSQLWGDARRASFPARRRRLGDVAPVAR